jgi:hypothetical protein
MPRHSTPATASIATIALLALGPTITGTPAADTWIGAAVTATDSGRAKGVRPANPGTRGDTPTRFGRWSARQMAVAKAIVDEGEAMGVPRRALVAAIACAMQESRLKVLANRAVPESMKVPNDGTGSDDRSVGPFQQIPRWWLGDEEDISALMEPRSAARKFYRALLDVDGWERKRLTVAIQAVQRSGYPNAYQQWAGQAASVVDRLS